MKSKIMIVVISLVLLVFVGCNWINNNQIPKLSKPNDLEINEDVLVWGNVKDAISYIVSIDNEENEVETNEFSLSYLEEAKDYGIKVKAVGDNVNFKDSAWSNEIIYSPEDLKIKLESPIGLKVENNILIWEKADNAVSYLVSINNEEKESNTNSYSLSYLGEGQKYKIKVKAIGDNIEFVDSDWSNEIDYDKERIIFEYLVKLDYNGATGEIFEFLAEENKKIGTLPIPTRENYEFLGWYNKAEKEKVESDYIVMKDLTLVAEWKALYECELIEAVGFEILVNEIKIDVETNVNTFDFTNKIIVSDQATWKLYQNSSLTNEVGKTVNLVEGINTFYLKITSKVNLDKIYTVIINKKGDTDERIKNAKDNLDKLYKDIDLVTSNLELITYDKDSACYITWVSDRPDIISSQGKLQRAYQEENIILSAIIEYNGHTEEVVYEVTSAGYKELNTGNIASGYQYTNYNAVTNELFETLDIIFCSFGLVDTNGNLKNNTSTMSCLGNIKNYIITKAHERGCYVVLSIGGGGQSESFATIAASETIRKKFANNIVAIINEYNLDGVDIDWETPTSAEAPTYTLLMKEVYTQVKANNSNHLVTTAITGGAWQPPKYDLPNSIKYIDYVNMMTYGLTNNGMQYHNSLYKSTSGRTLNSCSIDESIIIFNNLGVPNEKLIAGLSFYAMRQTFNGVSWVAASGSLTYTALVNNYFDNPNYIAHYDEECEQPYLLKADGTEFIHYDNPRSILAKCKYAASKKIAGVMYWQNGQDTTGQLLAAIKEGLKK